jgi:hypothetical protein
VLGRSIRKTLMTRALICPRPGFYVMRLARNPPLGAGADFPALPMDVPQPGAAERRSPNARRFAKTFERFEKI